MLIEPLYFAHPVVGDAAGKTPDEIAAIVAANLQRAHRWLGWLVPLLPDVAIRCSWLGYVASLPETPELRERGLRDDDSEVATCTGIVLCGGRLSSGMRRAITTMANTPSTNGVICDAIDQLDHERARYDGDGDPGCRIRCLKCRLRAVQQPLQRRYVLDLLDLGAEPPASLRGMPTGPWLRDRLTHARITGSNGPTTAQTWLTPMQG